MPMALKPSRDSENGPERVLSSTTEIQLSGESALFKLAPVSWVCGSWSTHGWPAQIYCAR